MILNRVGRRLPEIAASAAKVIRKHQHYCISLPKVNSHHFDLPYKPKMSDPKAQFVLPNDTGIAYLDCKTAFAGLTSKEKLYAHYLSQASWYGSLICLLQTSAESPGIYVLLQKLFRAQSVDDLQKLAVEKGLSEDEFKAFLVYAAGFYSNMGNYKSFGDTKFIPNLPKEKLQSLIESSAAYKTDPDGVKALWSKVSQSMFSLAKRQQQLGLGQEGVTTYFSDNCDINDAKIAQQFLDEKRLSPYNTRLFKHVQNGQMYYEVRLASQEMSGGGTGDMSVLGSHQFTPKGANTPITFQVTRGDYSSLLKSLVDNLSKAKEHAERDNEKNMIGKYMESFKMGSIPAHKDGSRFWIRNKSPIVEIYIGFIESYRDPFGVRGEFEGFVAMVNKEMSAKFGDLVNKAEHFLGLLPWGAAYEKDKFLMPDFTSLDVLMYGSSGIPAGINIPNYDDIRQEEGFKNVSLGNVLSAGYKDTNITFLSAKDKELYAALKAPSFEVQVGLHELLGHGSGKLFKKNADGTFNFDIEKVHTEKGGKITSWYEEGETWDSKFSQISSSYEECRAECVGIYLCLSAEILRIFGHTGKHADDIIYVNWLNMVRAGLLALEFYTPETNTWRQAHMQARYVILRVLLEAGEDLVKIEKIVGEDGDLDLLLTLDRSKIISTGKPAIGDFLQKLQVYKSTANVEKGTAMYRYYSAVTDDEEPHFLSLRNIVLARKQPRRMFVQCNTVLSGEDVAMKEYEATAAGLIKSCVERFPDPTIEKQLQELWEKDQVHFPL